MSKLRTKELNRYGISVPEAGVLFIAWSSNGSATPGKISTDLLLESHSVSELLVRMEKKGLIRRVKDLPRKNMLRIELTDKGREAYRKASKRESVSKTVSVLSKAEQEQLILHLKEINRKAMAGLK